MCVSPAVISIMSTLAAVGGAAVTGMASRNAAIAAEQQNRNNAVIAQRNAADARARGVIAEQDVQLKTRQLLGRQTNVLSERNIALNVGSPLDIIGDTAMFGKLDALTTRSNFEREALGYQAQGMNFSAAAEQSRARASAATMGMGASLFETALGGVGDYMRVTNPKNMRL